MAISTLLLDRRPWRQHSAASALEPADSAVDEAWVSCHNAHKGSPRSDFELGEVMGGVVIRIPIAD